MGVSLLLQKRLAASVLKCGKRKVWLDPNEVNEISMANSSTCHTASTMRNTLQRQRTSGMPVFAWERCGSATNGARSRLDASGRRAVVAGNLAAAALWLISKGAAGRHRSTAAVCRCRCLSWGEGSARAAVLGSSVNMLGSETPAPAPAPASAPQQQRSQRGCARVKTSSAPRSSPPQLRAHPLLALSCSYLRAKHPQAEEGWFHHPEAAEGALARAHQRLG